MNPSDLNPAPVRPEVAGALGLAAYHAGLSDHWASLRWSRRSRRRLTAKHAAKAQKLTRRAEILGAAKGA